jgi:uncharacterized cysteine cluster protein YcgN (CxxCxxCC family)
MSGLRDRFWERSIETLNRAEWEALCDGCGQCCVHKAEDEDTGQIYMTNVGCKLLDLQTARCRDYPNRKRQVPDCVKLTPKLALTLSWLPETCAYRLRAAQGGTLLAGLVAPPCQKANGDAYFGSLKITLYRP